jgi:class 3 adenylate cyclase/tetratricopeptide (TPR) repeat protein
VKVCSRCGEENLDRARYCMTCSTRLDLQGATEAEIRKTVTVVFCDVAGSTALGERLDPESLRLLMGTYFNEARAVLERHGGTVEKFIGDAVMSVFGVPSVHEDDALRAVRAAWDLRSALDDLNDRLEERYEVPIVIRTGVNTGVVVAGDSSAGQSFVTGDAVNVAARLEQAAPPGEILIGDSTHRLVRDSVRVEPLGALPVEGRGLPVTAFLLLDVPPEGVGLSRRLDSPLVGRQRELAVLDDVLDRTERQRVSSLVSLIGSPGIGKSRLTREFLAGAGDRARVVRGRCLPYGEGITFWPVTEVVKDAARVGDDDSPDQVLARIEALLADEPESALVAQRVAGVIGLAGGGAAIQESYWAVRKLLEALARGQPLIVVFDDIHWGQTAFLDLLEYLGGSAHEVRVMLVCIARPDLLDARPSWGTGQPNATTVHLEPLTEAESRQLITNLLKGAQVPEEALVRITQAAEGNPLFVEEMLRMLVDEGLLRKEGPTWVAIRDLSSVSMPPSIQAVLAARLDRLLPEEQAVIQRASVVGKVFWWGAVAELSPEEARPRIGTHLQSLVRKELIRPDPSEFAGEDAFRFGHILTLDAAYDSIPKQIRGELHARLADWLERVAGDRIREFEEIVGYHLEQAYRYQTELGAAGFRENALAERAGRMLGEAGLRAAQRGDSSAAADLLRRSVSLLPRADARRLEIVPDLSLALMDLGQFREAEELLTNATIDAKKSGDRRAEWWSLTVRSLWQHLTHPSFWVRQAPQELKQALQVFEELGYERGLALAGFLLGSFHLLIGQAAESAAAAERGVEKARQADLPRDEARSLSLLAEALLVGPTPIEEGLKRCESMTAEARGNQLLEAHVFLRAARLDAHLTKFEEARELNDRAQGILEELGLVSDVAQAEWNGGVIEFLAGEFGSAVMHLEIACRVFEGRGERGRSSRAGLALAEANFSLGKFEDALAWIQFAERTGTLEDVEIMVRGRLLRTKLVARRGWFEEAEGFGREAVALAGRTDLLDLQTEALLGLADVQIAGGKAADAESLLEEARSLCEWKGNLVLLGRTRQLLANRTSSQSSGKARPVI